MNRVYLLFSLVLVLLHGIQLHHFDNSLSTNKPPEKGLEVQLQVLPAAAEYESCTIEVRLINRGEKTIMVQKTASPDRGLYWEMKDTRGKNLREEIQKYEGVADMAAILPDEFVPLDSGRTITRRFRWADEYKDVNHKRDVKLRFIYSVKGVNTNFSALPVWIADTKSNEVKLSLVPGKVRVK